MDINEAWPGWTNTHGSGIIRTGITPPAVIDTGDHHAATDVVPPTLTQEDAPVEVDDADAASDTPPPPAPPPHALTEALESYTEKKARLQELQESIENAIAIANTIGAEWVAATDAMDTVHLMRAVSATATKERDAFYAKMRFFFWLPFLLFGTLGLLGIFIYLMPHTHSLMRHTSSFETDSETAADSPSVMKGERIRAQMLSAGCGLFNVLYAPTGYSVLTCCASVRSAGGAAVGQLPTEHDADTPP